MDAQALAVKPSLLPFDTVGSASASALSSEGYEDGVTKLEATASTVSLSYIEGLQAHHAAAMASAKWEHEVEKQRMVEAFEAEKKTLEAKRNETQQDLEECGNALAGSQIEVERLGRALNNVKEMRQDAEDAYAEELQETRQLLATSQADCQALAEGYLEEQKRCEEWKAGVTDACTDLQFAADLSSIAYVQLDWAYGMIKDMRFAELEPPRLENAPSNEQRGKELVLFKRAAVTDRTLLKARPTCTAQQDKRESGQPRNMVAKKDSYAIKHQKRHLRPKRSRSIISDYYKYITDATDGPWMEVLFTAIIFLPFVQFLL